MDETQIKKHIEQRTKERGELVSAWKCIEILNQQTAFSMDCYLELQARVSSRLAFIDRSILDHSREIHLPKDKNGIQVKIGDKIKGIGYITFQDGFKIDRTPVVTVNIQNGRLYFGNLSCESFTEGFFIVL
jgi:hypothetical protein